MVVSIWSTPDSSVWCISLCSTTFLCNMARKKTKHLIFKRRLLQSDEYLTRENTDRWILQIVWHGMDYLIVSIGIQLVQLWCSDLWFYFSYLICVWMRKNKQLLTVKLHSGKNTVTVISAKSFASDSHALQFIHRYWL